MKKEVGLWIDHRKAVIVTIENEVEMTREVKSNIEKHTRFSNSSKHPNDPSQPQGSSSEDVRDRQFDDHLDGFYDGIVSLIRGADAILIFGPGEAKVELESRLRRAELGERIVGIETVDKMTDPQIEAKVRGYFYK
jgi:hypothetical protein